MSGGLQKDYIPKPLAEYNEDEMRLLLKQTEPMAYYAAKKVGGYERMKEIGENIHSLSLVIALTKYKPIDGIPFANYLFRVMFNQATKQADDMGGRGIRSRPKTHRMISAVEIDALDRNGEEISDYWQLEIEPLVTPLSDGEQSQRESLAAALERLKESYPHYYIALQFNEEEEAVAKILACPIGSISHFKHLAKEKLKQYCGVIPCISISREALAPAVRQRLLAVIAAKEVNELCRPCNAEIDMRGSRGSRGSVLCYAPPAIPDEAYNKRRNEVRAAAKKQGMELRRQNALQGIKPPIQSEYYASNRSRLLAYQNTYNRERFASMSEHEKEQFREKQRLACRKSREKKKALLGVEEYNRRLAQYKQLASLKAKREGQAA